MKRFAALMIVAAMATMGMNAQDSGLRTKGGDMSLLFTLNGLQNIGAGNYMGGIGLGYYLSDGMQLRGGIGFGTSTETTGEGDAEQKEGTSMFSIAPALRINLMNSSNIVGYGGIGISYMMSGSSTESGGTETGSTSESTLGAGVFLGAEWFPWNNVSLGLEYGLGYSSKSSTSKQGDTEVDGPSTSGINLGLSTVQFTLAFYLN